MSLKDTHAGTEAADQKGRQRIADVAEALLRETGYAGMTLEAIAEQAEVPLDTVSEMFGSRLGVLVALFERVMLAEADAALPRRLREAPSACERVRLLATLARQHHGAEHQALTHLIGAGVKAPELDMVTRDRRARHHDIQTDNVERLAEAGWLKPELDAAAACAILCALTSQELYRRLIQECGWSAERYERWLFESLVLALGGPRRPDRD